MSCTSPLLASLATYDPSGPWASGLVKHGLHINIDMRTPKPEQNRDERSHKPKRGGEALKPLLLLEVYPPISQPKPKSNLEPRQHSIWLGLINKGTQQTMMPNVISPSHMPNVISPSHFADIMSKHWTETLGNKSSPKLQAVWRTMAAEFGLAILNANTMHSQSSLTTKLKTKPWYILQPPTGSGKTQGTVVYCSLVARSNATDDSPTGVLIVARLIEQCKDMVRAINELAGREAAYAHHSDEPLTIEDMSKADILVITQSALVNAFEGLVKDKRNKWEAYSTWRHGRRGLMIIDEALTGVVEENKITLDGLRRVIGIIPYAIREKHKGAVEALIKLETLLEGFASSVSSKHKIAWGPEIDSEIEAPREIDLYPLRVALRSLRLDQLVIGKDSSQDRDRLMGIIDRTFKDAQAVLDRWAVYSRKGKEHTLNSALLLIPEDAPPAVVLDATASQSELWEILGDRANVRPVPQDARSYANVTLHVCRWDGMGKHKMIKEAATRFPRLIDDLQRRLGADRKVFVCTHKAVEHVALGFAPHFHSYSVGHWGAVDGRNDWQEFDTAVIFGLPYRDSVWANNVFFSIQGLRDDKWLQQPKWREHDNVRLMMQNRQLSVSVIQAINRVRCRRVVNERGDCSPTDVFIVLPDNSTGDAMLSAIQQEMPKIKVMDWEFEPDGQKVRIRKGSNHEALLSLMNHKLPGETAWSEVKVVLRLTRAGDKELRGVLRDCSHPLTKELGKIGVRYDVRGQGRGSKTFLLKAA
jgi:hypothetical protein